MDFRKRLLILLLVELLIGLNPNCCLASNILFFFAVGSHSHRTAIEPLAHKLTQEGHNVTFLAPMTPTKPNPLIHEFCPQTVKDYYTQVLSKHGDVHFPNRLADKYRNDFPNPRGISEMEHIACDLVFNSPEFIPWVNSVQFDLVIMDLTGNKCGYGLAYKFNALTMVTMTLPPWSHDEDMFGLPMEMSWLHNFATTNFFTQDPTLYDKIYVTLYRIYSYFYTNWITLPKTEQIVRNSLGMPHMPNIQQLERDTSLVLMNQHFSSDYARALPPHVIQVGGMHCEAYQTKPLPKNLQEFIDGAGDLGFVYISFGTIVSMSSVPKDFVNSLFETVRKTKTRFLWRWDVEKPENVEVPSNVLISTWFPQLDLLASKSIRGFVTHGGQNSANEAAYYGVPVIVVPVAFDQPYHAQAAAHHGMGIHLELSEMKEKFQESLDAILNDERYKKTAKLVSQRYRDRPMKAIETASFWTNYVLRNKDVSYMRPMGNLRQTWWQRRLLDVWGTIFCVILMFIFVLIKLIHLMSLRLCQRENQLNVKAKQS